MTWTDDLPRTIYGIHDLYNMSIWDGYLAGWTVDPVAIGHDPEDFSTIGCSDPGIICRIQHGWHPEGCIPLPEHDDDFLHRLDNFVSNSSGCHIWILGNEPNLSIERPNGQPIDPERYAELYKKAHYVIHHLQGHEDDWLLTAAVGPWNVETRYPGNKSGDWIRYFEDMLWDIIGWDCTPDGICLHTYSRGPDPGALSVLTYMESHPFEHYQSGFLTYEDFMYVVPERLRHLPIFITEANQNQPWLDANNGWVREAYRIIDEWNQDHEPDNQQIRALVLYSWQQRQDGYHFGDKNGVITDFRQALTYNYTYKTQEDNGKEPPNMRIAYQTSFEEGFYDYEGEGELTVPEGWQPKWDDAYGVRPEYDKKDTKAGQPEVYTGRYAANFFHLTSLWKGMLWKSFSLEPGKRVRATVRGMAVRDSTPGGAGMQLRIFDGERQESEWISTNSPDYQDRTWQELTVEGIVPESGEIVVELFGVTDHAVSWHTHWDDFMLEIEDDGTEPPEPEPPEDGGLMAHLVAARDSTLQAVDDIDAAMSFAESGGILCLPLTKV